MLVHDRFLVHLDDGFRSRWAVAQSTVWSLHVVVFSPFFDDDLHLFQVVEDLAIKQLVPEAGIEAFAISVFPWRSRFDVGGLCSNRLDPIANSFSNKLRPVV